MAAAISTLSAPTRWRQAPSCLHAPIATIIGYFQTYHLDWWQSPLDASGKRAPCQTEAEVFYARYVLERHSFKCYVLDETEVQNELLKHSAAAIERISSTSYSFFSSLIRVEHSVRAAPAPEALKTQATALKAAYTHLGTLVATRLKPHIQALTPSEIDHAAFVITHPSLNFGAHTYFLPLTDLAHVLVNIYNFGSPSLKKAMEQLLQTAIPAPSQKGKKEALEVSVEQLIQLFEKGFETTVSVLIENALNEMGNVYDLLNHPSKALGILKKAAVNFLEKMFKKTGFPETPLFLGVAALEKSLKPKDPASLCPVLLLLPPTCQIDASQLSLTVEEYKALLLKHAPLALRMYNAAARENEAKCAVFMNTYGLVLHQLAVPAQPPRYALALPAVSTMPFHLLESQELLEGGFNAGAKAAELLVSDVLQAPLEKTIATVQTQLALAAATFLKTAQLPQDALRHLNEVIQNFIQSCVPSLVAGMKEVNTNSKFPPIFKEIVLKRGIRLVTQVAIHFFQKRAALESRALFKEVVELSAQALIEMTETLKKHLPQKPASAHS